MKIGNHVFISGGVLTTNDNTMGIHGYNENTIIGPTINDHVQIGAGAILLPNLTIGENALIGAGAVVTKDIAPGIRVKGIPARMIREQILSSDE